MAPTQCGRYEVQGSLHHDLIHLYGAGEFLLLTLDEALKISEALRQHVEDEIRQRDDTRRDFVNAARAKEAGE